MKTIIVETPAGGIIRLENCTALGMEHIAHDKGVYGICEGDKLTEV